MDVTWLNGEHVAICMLDDDLPHQLSCMDVQRCPTPPDLIADARVQEVLRTEGQQYVSVLDSPSTAKVIVR